MGNEDDHFFWQHRGYQVLVKAVSGDKWGLELHWFCLTETGRRETEQRE